MEVNSVGEVLGAKRLKQSISLLAQKAYSKRKEEFIVGKNVMSELDCLLYRKFLYRAFGLGNIDCSVNYYAHMCISDPLDTSVTL